MEVETAMRGADFNSKTNILNIKQLSEYHDPFHSIFVKENRIGVFRGNVDGNKVLSGITRKRLNECIEKMTVH